MYWRSLWFRGPVADPSARQAMSRAATSMPASRVSSAPTSGVDQGSFPQRAGAKILGRLRLSFSRPRGGSLLLLGSTARDQACPRLFLPCLNRPSAYAPPSRRRQKEAPTIGQDAPPFRRRGWRSLRLSRRDP